MSELTTTNYEDTERFQRPIMQNPPMRKANGSWARNNIQKANRCTEQLENTLNQTKKKNGQTGSPFRKIIQTLVNLSKRNCK